MPTALGPKTAAFYLLAFGAVFAIARAPKALTLFEKAAVVVLLVLAVEATRGVTWFILFMLVALPSAIHGLKLPSISLGSNNASVVSSSVVAVAALLIAASRSTAWFTRDYPTSGGRVVASAAGSTKLVFTNGAFGDWLLLKHPSLRGRIAYDARFELLPDGRLADAVAVSIGRYDYERILTPFDLVVLRPKEHEIRNTLRRAGWRRVDAGPKIVVLGRVKG
jgi:hypothetical protein